MAGRLQELLSPGNIALDLKSTDHLAALEEVASRLKGDPGISNYDGFFQQLLERDRLDTTCLGYDLAIPTPGRNTSAKS